MVFKCSIKFSEILYNYFQSIEIKLIFDLKNKFMLIFGSVDYRQKPLKMINTNFSENGVKPTCDSFFSKIKKELQQLLKKGRKGEEM